MKLLIDTNVFIPLEPANEVELFRHSTFVSDLHRLAALGGHTLFLHPAAKADLERDTNPQRKRIREIQFAKYPLLPDPPEATDKLALVLGSPPLHSNDWVDNQLLASLAANAVDFLITEDKRIRAKAARLDLTNRVVTVLEALSVISDLFDRSPRTPPSVMDVRVHAIDPADPIFESLRADYPGFDSWFTKCRLEHRRAWIVKPGGSNLAGICIVKEENAGEYGLRGKVLKACTMKVSDLYNGNRFGELLLKPVFSYAHSNRFDWIYLTVFDKHTQLINLIHEFGFERLNVQTDIGESVFAKHLSVTGFESPCLSPLDFHIKYGPLAIDISGASKFIVPIQPLFHDLLFPEATQQMYLIPRCSPYGNAIRKAYLCHSPCRTLTPGSVLLFYRSHDRKEITCVGVAENTLISRSVDEVARFVGKRTVYTYEEIRQMCEHDVLAVLFRQAFIVDPPMGREELVLQGAIRRAPQSILKLPEGMTQWLQTRLGRQYCYLSSLDSQKQ
jgi:hypothetical protein